MAKRKAAPEERTTSSWAYEYIDERRFGKLRRVQVSYPMSEDRRAAGNIPYTDEGVHRTWRGKVPKVSRDLGDPDVIKGPKSLDDAEFQFVNDAPSQKNIESDQIGTPSGIEELIDPPGTPGSQQGYPTTNPVEINYRTEENNVPSGDFFIAGPIDTENRKGDRYPYKYFTENPASKDIRMGWGVKPEFDNPTEPAVRYPKKGAYRRKNHKLK